MYEVLDFFPVSFDSLWRTARLLLIQLQAPSYVWLHQVGLKQTGHWQAFDAPDFEIAK